MVVNRLEATLRAVPRGSDSYSNIYDANEEEKDRESCAIVVRI
jgi:hypothetical protein